MIDTCSHCDAPLNRPTWQPIQTAPKDGSHVLLFYLNALGKPRTVIGEWTSLETDEYDDDGLEIRSTPAWYESSWASEEAHHVEGEPTHWMRLPDSPASGGTVDG